MKRGGVFGTWDAPATDGVPPMPTPVGEMCMYCHERIREGDNGMKRYGYTQHRECSLRSAMGGIGHLLDHEAFCGSELGPDAGLSFRESALLVWRMVVEGEEITPMILLAAIEEDEARA